MVTEELQGLLDHEAQKDSLGYQECRVLMAETDYLVNQVSMVFMVEMVWMEYQD